MAKVCGEGCAVALPRLLTPLEFARCSPGRSPLRTAFALPAAIAQDVRWGKSRGANRPDEDL
jgi:hypothetical protein